MQSQRRRRSGGTPDRDSVGDLEGHQVGGTPRSYNGGARESQGSISGRVSSVDPFFWQVSGYANYYVSNCGRVKNIATERILKPSIMSCGYLGINLCKNGKLKLCTLHRLGAISFIDNLNDYKCVDHINRNPLNNSVTNLRWCTYQENNMNMSKQNNRSSKFKGVSYNKDKKKWKAYITYNRKLIHLGYFKTQEEAGRAYNNKARELFGDYANLNVF